DRVVLQLPVAIEIADDDVEQAAVGDAALARRTEQDNSAVVVRPAGHREVQDLQRALQHAEAGVPRIAIDAITEWGAAFRPGCLGIVEEDLLRALVVDGDAEQSAFAVEGDVDVEDVATLDHAG